VSVSIREATLDDAEKLRRYAGDLFAEHLPGIPRRDMPSLDAEVAFIRSYLDPANATLLVAEEGGEILGNIGLLSGSLSELAHVGEFGISVARDHRGLGIGTALIASLEQWAPAHGIRRIEVRAFASNPGALRLYERLGYEREGVLRGAAYVDGAYVAVIVLAKLLS
jgi:RimJ/RimL family protein N-acetyltransferase